MIPESTLPTAQISDALLPQMLSRSVEVPDATGCHSVPFQWTMVPPLPTAQASFGALAHTACRSLVVLLSWRSQLEPFQRSAASDRIRRT